MKYMGNIVGKGYIRFRLLKVYLKNGISFLRCWNRKGKRNEFKEYFVWWNKIGIEM